MSLSLSKTFSASALPSAFLPKTQFTLRLCLAVITLVYLWAIPEPLRMGHYDLVLVGFGGYLLTQAAVAWQLTKSRSTSLIYFASVIDITAATLASAVDPSHLTLLATLFIGTVALGSLELKPRAQWSLWLINIAALMAVITTRHLHINEPLAISHKVLLGIIIVLSVLPNLASVLAHQLRNDALQSDQNDPITDLGTRRSFYDAAKYLLPYHYSNLTPVIVMLADIDGAFVNGKHQKLSAIQRVAAWRTFANIAQEHMHAADIVAHYGNGTFAFLLSNASTNDAEALAHKIREQFSAWAAANSSPATAFIGAAALPPDPMALDHILNIVNDALTRARQTKNPIAGAVFTDPTDIRHSL